MVLADESTRERKALEVWFRSRGVPHFMRRYSGRDAVPVLLCWLFLVVAFQVGAAPWLHLSAPRLLAAPLILLFLTGLVAPRLVGLFQSGTAGSRRALLAVPLGLYALWLAVTVLSPGDIPGFWSSMWVDFPLIFSVLVTSAVLARPDVWQFNPSDRASARRRGLIVVIPGAVVLFSLEGSLIPSFNESLNSMLIGVLPSAHALTPGVAALPVVCWLLYVAVSLARDAWDNATPALNDREASTLAIVMPMLVLLLGVETTLLPHASNEAWVQAVPIAPGVLILALGATLWRRFTDSPRTARSGDGVYVSLPAVACWLVIYLLTYPVLVLLFFEIDLYQHGLVGWEGFAAALAINLLYLLLGVGIVGFAFGTIVAWAVREAWRDRGSVFEGMFRGLPLLFVFTAFFLFGAELWEAVTKASVPKFLGLLGVLVGLTTAFILITATREIRRRSRFRSWDELVAAARGPHEPPSASDEPVMAVLKSLDAQPERKLSKPELTLRGRQWINAMSVLAVYQALVFVPVLIASGVLFYWLAKLAVPVEVAANWIYGDQADEVAEREILDSPFLEQPWARTAIVLAFFSLLYVAVTVLSDKDQRESFFRAADEGVSQRFAAAIAYRRAYYPDGECELPTVAARVSALLRRPPTEQRQPSGTASADG